MSTPTLAAIATEFLCLCASGQVREAYDRYVAEDFRHHNGNPPAS